MALCRPDLALIRFRILINGVFTFGAMGVVISADFFLHNSSINNYHIERYKRVREEIKTLSLKDIYKKYLVDDDYNGLGYMTENRYRDFFVMLLPDGEDITYIWKLERRRCFYGNDYPEEKLFSATTKVYHINRAYNELYRYLRKYGYRDAEYENDGWSLYVNGSFSNITKKETE